MKVILAIFFSVCFLTVYIYAILLLFGIGGEALAGYHISSKEATDCQAHKKTLRKAGICLLLIAGIAHAMCLLFIFGIYIWGGIIVGLLIIFSIFSIYILNKKNDK